MGWLIVPLQVNGINADKHAAFQEKNHGLNCLLLVARNDVDVGVYNDEMMAAMLMIKLVAMMTTVILLIVSDEGDDDDVTLRASTISQRHRLRPKKPLVVATL